MAAETAGRRLLAEVECVSLDEVLDELRKLQGFQTPRLGIAKLDEIWRRHGGRLEISGNALPLLYLIVDTAVEKQRGLVVVVDVDGKFDLSRLHCDLNHVHLLRPSKGNLAASLASIDEQLLHGKHQSHDRALIATIVNGGQGGDIMTSWRGWLRVEREMTERFRPKISIQEALRQRDRRQMAVDNAYWVATSEVGQFKWTAR